MNKGIDRKEKSFLNIFICAKSGVRPNGAKSWNMKIAEKIIPWKIDPAKWFNNRIEFHTYSSLFTDLISTYMHMLTSFWIFYTSISKRNDRILRSNDIYLVRNRISTWRNKIVIYRYCLIMSNAFARYLPVYFQLTHCTYLSVLRVCASSTLIHVELP